MSGSRANREVGNTGFKPATFSPTGNVRRADGKASDKKGECRRFGNRDYPRPIA
jgi:hypothetical protein